MRALAAVFWMNLWSWVQSVEYVISQEDLTSGEDMPLVQHKFINHNLTVFLEFVAGTGYNWLVYREPKYIKIEYGGIIHEPGAVLGGKGWAIYNITCNDIFICNSKSYELWFIYVKGVLFDVFRDDGLQGYQRYDKTVPKFVKMHVSFN